MKTQLNHVLLALLLSTCKLPLATLHAQGSLTPPGAPAPTMRTLAQIEPRTPISSLPFIITTSGSYYLTTNLTGVSGQHGISISNNDVTLDLNGFVLQGVPGSLFGIHVPGSATNLVVRNGKVRGWGSVGVEASGVWNGEFSELQVSQNAAEGLSCGRVSLLNRCSAFTNGSYGIYAGDNSRVVDCLAYGNQGDGFRLQNSCSIHGCSGELNGGNGIQCRDAAVVGDCAVLGNGGVGIGAGWGSTISSCTARNNLSDGFNCGGYGQISHCTATANQRHGIKTNVNTFVLENQCSYNGYGTNSGAGIYVDYGSCRIEGNNLTGNDQGILCTNSIRNFIIRNSATGNVSDYVISGTQTIGPIITTTGTITNSNPWANFSF